jgi:phosphoribosylglycinamide formyltransferase-1
LAAVCGRAEDVEIGILASHEGSVLQAIIDAADGPHRELRPCAVISNNSRSGAAERALRSGIPFAHLSAHTHPDPAALDEAIAAALSGAGAELVFLAGYMKKLGPATLARFANRILNTHPALLPKFGGQGMYGDRVHRAVLAAGETRSGVSVHLVDAEYDTGPVVAQRAVDVLAGDTAETLAQRVRMAERALVVETLAAIAGGRITLPS